jgi:hypothetical protein
MNKSRYTVIIDFTTDKDFAPARTPARYYALALN